jgi:hypothetical protein
MSLAIRRLTFVLVRVISWIALHFLEKPTIHEITPTEHKLVN